MSDSALRLAGARHQYKNLLGKCLQVAVLMSDTLLVRYVTSNDLPSIEHRLWQLHLRVGLAISEGEDGGHQTSGRQPDQLASLGIMASGLNRRLFEYYDMFTPIRDVLKAVTDCLMTGQGDAFTKYTLGQLLEQDAAFMREHGYVDFLSDREGEGRGQGATGDG